LLYEFSPQASTLNQKPSTMAMLKIHGLRFRVQAYTFHNEIAMEEILSAFRNMGAPVPPKPETRNPKPRTPNPEP